MDYSGIQCHVPIYFMICCILYLQDVVLTPSDGIVIKVFAALRAEDLDHHAVEMQPFHQHPGERTEEEEMQQHGHDLTWELGDGGQYHSLWPLGSGQVSRQHALHRKLIYFENQC